MNTKINEYESLIEMIKEQASIVDEILVSAVEDAEQYYEESDTSYYDSLFDEAKEFVEELMSDLEIVRDMTLEQMINVKNEIVNLMSAFEKEIARDENKYEDAGVFISQCSYALDFVEKVYARKKQKNGVKTKMNEQMKNDIAEVLEHIDAIQDEVPEIIQDFVRSSVAEIPLTDYFSKYSSSELKEMFEQLQESCFATPLIASRVNEYALEILEELRPQFIELGTNQA